MRSGGQGFGLQFHGRSLEDALRRPVGGGPEGAPLRAAGPWIGGRLGTSGSPSSHSGREPYAPTRASAAPSVTDVAWSRPVVTISQLGVLPRAATIA